MSGILALAGSSAFAQVLTHDYHLNNTLADSLGGPALVGLGGTVSPTGYAFGADQGLSLSSAINANNYSIEVDFSLDTTGGYRKIVDFKNLTSDNGVYNLNTDVNFYNQSFSGAGVIPTATPVDLIITRDGASGLLEGYINGTPEISFNDLALQQATFSGPNNIINFFVDDFDTGQGEASGGDVTRIKIWDGALTADQVESGQLPGRGGVPDMPCTAGLMSVAMAGVAALKRFANRPSR